MPARSTFGQQAFAAHSRPAGKWTCSAQAAVAAAAPWPPSSGADSPPQGSPKGSACGRSEACWWSQGWAVDLAKPGNAWRIGDDGAWQRVNGHCSKAASGRRPRRGGGGGRRRHSRGARSEGKHGIHLPWAASCRPLSASRSEDRRLMGAGSGAAAAPLTLLSPPWHGNCSVRPWCLVDCCCCPARQGERLAETAAG